MGPRAEDRGDCGCRTPFLCKLRTTVNCAIACCLAILFVVSLCGCGKDNRQKMQLEGTVTLDGKPLAAGTIRLSLTRKRRSNDRRRTNHRWTV